MSSIINGAVLGLPQKLSHVLNGYLIEQLVMNETIKIAQ